MAHRQSSFSPWPDETQTLLLRAALFTGEPAIRAWREWQSRVRFHDLDSGSHLLLTLLYHNLVQQGVKDHPALDLYKGVYRYHWCQNQTRLKRLATILQDLHGAGVRTLIVKGAALATSYYSGVGVRPMNDVDVVVPLSALPAALRVLEERGWTPAVRPVERHVPFLHAVGFRHEQLGAFDLHWHVLSECLEDDADELFWAGAVPAKILDVATLTLNATDHLLHTVAHGIRSCALAPLRWIADAMTILRVGGSRLDWPRLLAHSRQRQHVLVTRKALGYLRDAFDAPVPPEVLGELQQSCISKTEQWDYSVRMRGSVLLGGLPLHWVRYLRSHRHLSWWRHIGGFSRYLSRALGGKHAWQLPLYVAHRTCRRIAMVTGIRREETPPAFNSSC